MSDLYNEDRREFFRTLARGLLAGVALTGIGKLIFKHGETCVGDGICRNCASFSECGLPQALSAKAALRKGNPYGR